MELKSTELFEAVKNEYPELSASEVIAFLQAEYLAQIAENVTANERAKVLDCQPYMGGMIL